MSDTEPILVTEIPRMYEARQFIGLIYECHGSWDGHFPPGWAEIYYFANVNVVQVGSRTHGGPNEFLMAIHGQVIYPSDWVVRSKGYRNAAVYTPAAFRATFREL